MKAMHEIKISKHAALVYESTGENRLFDYIGPGIDSSTTVLTHRYEVVVLS